MPYHAVVIPVHKQLKTANTPIEDIYLQAGIDSARCMPAYRPKQPARYRTFPDSVRSYAVTPTDAGGVPSPPAAPQKAQPVAAQAVAEVWTCPAILVCMHACSPPQDQ